MTEEQVKKASELYAKKSDIFSELEKLTSTDYKFSIGYQGLYFGVGHIFDFRNLPSDFISKVKGEVIEQIQNALKEIDKELELL
jgi:hypothetical protein